MVREIGCSQDHTAPVLTVTRGAVLLVNFRTLAQSILRSGEAPDVIHQVPTLVGGELVAKSRHFFTSPFRDDVVKFHRGLAAHIIYIAEVARIRDQTLTVSAVT